MDPHNNPGPGLLDDVQPAAGFDMDAMIEETAGTPKQQYDAAFTDPDIPPVEGQQPTGAAQAKAKRAAANMLMLMIDRAQAGVFTLFGAKGHGDDFRFNKADRSPDVDRLVASNPGSVGISAVTGDGVDLLLATIGDRHQHVLGGGEDLAEAGCNRLRDLERGQALLVGIGGDDDLFH